MERQVFALPGRYPDFPSPRRVLDIGSPRPEVKRGRAPLPTAMKAVNQLRIRQFKHQIDTINRISYDLNRKDFADKVKSTSLTDRPTVGVFPRIDLHHQVLALIKSFPTAATGLNDCFQLITDANKDGNRCPLCKSLKNSGKINANSTEIHLETKKYLQKCKLCSDLVASDRILSDFVCVSCENCTQKRKFREKNETISVYLSLEIEGNDIKFPDLTQKRSKSIRKNAFKSFKSEENLPKRSISGPHFKQNFPLKANLDGFPLILQPGSQFIHLILNKNLSKCEKLPAISREISDSLSISPNLSRKNSQEMSFSDNLASKIDVFEGVFDEEMKELHINTEKTLTDYINFAKKYSDLVKRRDLMENYLLKYVETVGKVGKLMVNISPETVSVVEMCVKGLVLLLDAAVTRGSEGYLGLEEALAETNCANLE